MEPVAAVATSFRWCGGRGIGRRFSPGVESTGGGGIVFCWRGRWREWEGRDYLLPDDVKAAALPVLRHRIVLKPEADLEGLTTDQVITQVIAAEASGEECPRERW